MARATELKLASRDAIRDGYLADLKRRMPGLDTAFGSEAFARASAFADTVLPLFTNASVILDGTSDVTATAARLNLRLKEAGTARLGAKKAAGFVAVEASVGGTPIVLGDLLTYPETGARYSVLIGRTYQDGQLCAIRAIEGGAGGNAPVGARLTWVTPRAGCAPTCAVASDNDGEGLTGGAEEETDAQAQERVVGVRANPGPDWSAAGIKRLLESKEAVGEHGVALDRVFVYPCVPVGTGGLTLCFLVRGAGAARLPGAAELTAITTYLGTKGYAGDVVNLAAVLQDPASYLPTFGVRWAPGTVGWANQAPFPFGRRAIVGGTLTATGCSAVMPDGYAGASAPAPGTDLALYDPASRTVKRKRVGSVSGAGPWVLTFTATGVTDDSYVPVANASICPWADDLPALLTAVLAEADKLTPGQQVNPPDGAVYRFLRFPAVTNRDRLTLGGAGTNAIFDTGLVSDVTDATPAFTPTLGTPGIASYLALPATVGFFAI